MLLTLEADQSIEYLKYYATQETQNIKFPHKAAQRLNEILLNDQIKPEEFKTELTQIMASTNTISWKIILYLNNLQTRLFEQITSISWLQIILIFSVIFFIFILNKRFKLQKPAKKFYKFSTNIITRLSALLGYFPAIVQLYANYLPLILPKYPSLALIVPSFMQKAVAFYLKPNYGLVISFIHLFFILFLIQTRTPKSRFVRFNFVRGLILSLFEGVPASIFAFFSPESQFSGMLTSSQLTKTALLFFAINLSWLIPCLFQAITLSYPKNSFIREAVEVHLGRENDEDFKWWDRQ